MMKKFLYAASVLLMIAFSSAAHGALNRRPLSSYAVSSEMSVCGSPLVIDTSDGAEIYVPFRRRLSLYDDEGRIVKYSVSDGSAHVIWNSSVRTPRRIMIAPVSGGHSVSGLLNDLSAEAAEAVEELSSDQCARLAELLCSRTLGVPYPSAFVRAEGVLYAQFDDGLISAFDDDSGEELWAFFPPQFLKKEIAAVLFSQDRERPWLAAGGLTAEKLTAGGEKRVFLWGTLGLGAKGVFCLDVTNPVAPVFSWAREERENEEQLWGVEDTQANLLGFSAASPLAVSFAGRDQLLIPSGAFAAASLASLDPVSGKNIWTSSGASGTELCFSPLGIQSGSGAFARLDVCDSSGGVQEFVRQDEKLVWNWRLDLRQITGEESLRLKFSPIFCSQTRGSWIAFVGESDRGVVVAASPAPLRERSWSDLPWRGGSWGWYHVYEILHDVVLCFYRDGQLWLVAKEDNRPVVTVIDIAGRRLEVTQEIEDGSVVLPVAGKVIQLVPQGNGVRTGEISVPPLLSATVLYTLFH